jgi:hypothetical protein
MQPIATVKFGNVPPKKEEEEEEEEEGDADDTIDDEDDANDEADEDVSMGGCTMHDCNMVLSLGPLVQAPSAVLVECLALSAGLSLVSHWKWVSVSVLYCVSVSVPIANCATFSSPSSPECGRS